MFKRILCALLAATAVFAFASCGKKNTSAYDTAATVTDTAADTATETKKEKEVKTPEGFTLVDYESYINDKQLSIKEVSASYIGENYVLNVIYATAQTGNFFASTESDPFIYDKIGDIESSASGAAIQFELPAKVIDAVKEDNLVIKFVITGQTDMDAYVIKVKIPDAFKGLEHNEGTVSVDIPFKFTPYQENKVNRVFAVRDGDGYKFSFEYELKNEVRININYPKDENTIDVSCDPTEYGTPSDTEMPEELNKDPKISGKGVYEFTYPAEKLVDENGGEIKNMIIRLYDNDFYFDILELDLATLGRLK